MSMSLLKESSVVESSSGMESGTENAAEEAFETLRPVSFLSEFAVFSEEYSSYFSAMSVSDRSSLKNGFEVGDVGAFGESADFGESTFGDSDAEDVVDFL